mgnify:CR=1 FL=1
MNWWRNIKSSFVRAFKSTPTISKRGREMLNNMSTEEIHRMYSLINKGETVIQLNGKNGKKYKVEVVHGGSYSL